MLVYFFSSLTLCYTLLSGELGANVICGDDIRGLSSPFLRMASSPFRAFWQHRHDTKDEHSPSIFLQSVTSRYFIYVKPIEYILLTTPGLAFAVITWRAVDKSETAMGLEFKI